VSLRRGRTPLVACYRSAADRARGRRLAPGPGVIASRSHAFASSDRQCSRSRTGCARGLGAIVLRYYFGADYSEIAATLGLSEASVSETLARAKANLRDHLR
jgi:hypothetical protein